MKRMMMLGIASGAFAGASLTVLALGAPSFGQANPPGAAASPAVAAAAQLTHWGSTPNLADLVEKVSPSVVQIIVRTPGQVLAMNGPGDLPDAFRGTPFEDFFRRGVPGQGQGQRETPDRMGSGSGFFIDQGYIVTNNHVVDDAKKVTVKFSDGREIDATVVGKDPKTDLAVVKVDAKDLPPALAWGDSDHARPGDSVFAIGSPFNLGNTVTSGIISARGRDINSGPYDDYIQVDAPINMGNSGGPLFDQAGRVIGVNSAIFSPSGGNVGIGFSIPSSLAQSVVQQIIDHGSVSRGWLGVGIQPVTQEIADSLGLKEAKGALVRDVTADSPAGKAGLKTGDLIQAFGDTEVKDVHDLTRAVADTKAGTTRDVKIVRDGRPQTVKVKIAALADTDLKKPKTTSNPTASSSDGGVDMPGLGLSVTDDDGAAVVADVEVNSPASDAGVRPGDKIISVNQTDVKTASAARKAVEDVRKQRRTAVLLQIDRNGQKVFLGVPFSAE